jgi:hypothetical protein
MEARLQDICICVKLRGFFEGELYIYRRNDLNIGYILEGRYIKEGDILLKSSFSTL